MNKVKFPVNESRNSENIDRMASHRLNITIQYTTHIHTLLSIEYNLQATQFTFLLLFLHLLLASNNLHTTIFVSPILFSQLLFISKFTMKSHELYIFSLEWRLRCIVFTAPWKIARKKSELVVNYMVRTCEPANTHKLHSC